MNSRKSNEPTKPTRLAITMSIVYPGIGQFMQRRYPAGMLFLGATTVLLIMFLMSFGAIMLAYYRVWISPSEVHSPPGITGFLSCLVMLLLVYAAAIADAYLGYRRQSLAWSKKKHRLPPELPHN